MTTLPRKSLRLTDALELRFDSESMLQEMEQKRQQQQREIAQQSTLEREPEAPELPSFDALRIPDEPEPPVTAMEPPEPQTLATMEPMTLAAVPKFKDIAIEPEPEAEPERDTSFTVLPNAPDGRDMVTGGDDRGRAPVIRGPVGASGSGMKYGPIDHSSRDAFVRSMAPYALEAQQRTGIPAEIMLAININEQGTSSPAPGNNYFGIKGSNPRTGANTGAVSTWEDYGSGPVQTKDTFRAYDSPAESYEDFGQFLKDNPRYHGALRTLQETGSPEAFIRAVHKAGYATDPAWSDKILAIANGVRGAVQQAQSAPQPVAESPADVSGAAVPGGSGGSADRGAGLSAGVATPGGLARPAGLNVEGFNRLDDIMRERAGVPGDGNAPESVGATQPVSDTTGASPPAPSAPPVRDDYRLDPIAPPPFEEIAIEPPARDDWRTGSTGQVEPGDFEVPGYDVMASVRPRTGSADLPTAEVTSQEPGTGSGSVASSTAVEPPPAEPSLGDRIKQTFVSFGEQLGNLLAPPKESPGAIVAERQGTLPGTPQAEALAQEPMPLAPVTQALAEGPAGPAGTALEFVRQLRESSRADWDTLTELDETNLGRSLTPEEQAARDEALVRIATNTYNGATLKNIGPAVRGVIGGVADDAARAIRGPVAGLVDQVDDAGRTMDRYYHGTGSDFARPDPGKFDENGLFGPGYYITDDPRVSGSYTTARVGGPFSRQSAGLNRQILEVTDKLKDPELSAAERTDLERRLASYSDMLGSITAESGIVPNIRPVDVPRDLRLLDADGPAPEELLRIADDIFIEGRRGIRTGADLFQSLTEEFRRKDEAVDWLMANGYDGIKYAGGKRVPMRDAAGQPIEHEAIVIFPESLDKIRNATAGTPGGLVPESGPRTIDQDLATAAGRMATGGVAGGYEASQQEGAEPLDIGRGVLLGAAGGLARGAVRDRMGPGAAGSLARVAERAREAPVSDTGDIPWEPLYGKPARKMPDPRAGVEGLERWRRQLVNAWTDNRVDMAEMQKAAQRHIGRSLTADEMVTELSRVNPNMAAKVRIDEGLRPAIQHAGDDKELLSELLTYRDNIDVATATENPSRKFSGGLTAAESEQRIAEMERILGPERWQRLQDASDQIRAWVDEYRERMVKEGVWSQELGDELRDRYPNYVPTRILDYMKDPQAMGGGTRGVSLRDRGLRRLTVEGTTKEREDPIVSLMRYAQDSEAILAKNRTFNAFANLAAEAPDVVKARAVPSDYTAKAGEKLVTGFIDGNRYTYAVDPPIAAAVSMDAGQVMPGFLTALPTVFRELITRSPVFIAGQIPLDAFSAIVRTASREGGPQHAPRVAAEIVRAYWDAFQGLPSGEFKGDLARFLKEGAGMAGLQQRSAEAMATKLDDITRRNMLEIRSTDDAKRLAKWLGTMEWSQSVGQRVEMAPRLAAGRMGEARALREGADAATAALRGMGEFRDVTLDFQRGGWLAKTMNQMIPFFNVGFQSSAVAARAFRENPKAFPLTVATMIGTPAVMAEAWNRADPQRERDYEDVPDYVKDRGIVIMLPGVTGEDPQGNKRPNYALIPMRELAPFAILAREAAAKAMGKETNGWQALLSGAISAATPIQATGAADVFSTLNPVGANTALQLSADRDFFRGRDIATERNDEEASAFSKGLAERLGVRPSQVEFAIRDLGGHLGAAGLAASDIAAGKERGTGIQDMPLVGGLAKRFVGNAIGQNLQDARDEMITPAVRQALRDAGMRDDQLMPVRGEVMELPLSRSEQAAYQEAFNRELSRYAERLLGHPRWGQMDAKTREGLLRDFASDARESAAIEVLKTIPAGDRKDRLRKALEKKAA